MEVRAIAPGELDAADRLVRVAFGTFLGLPEPTRTFGEAQVVRTRARHSPDDTLVALDDGEIVGVVQVARWGRAWVLGPLAVSPRRWDGGVGRTLLAAALERADGAGASLTALFTFPSSPKHIALYQRYGFAPQHVVPVMTRTLSPRSATGPAPTLLGPDPSARARLTGVTDALYPGLDLSLEVGAVYDQGVGEVVVLEDGRGFAVCHLGAGEAAPGVCYVKFGAVAPGPAARTDFLALLARVEALAHARGLATLEAGVDAGRRAAHATLVEAGWRAQFVGLHMTRPDALAWSGPGAFALDDLR